MRTIHKFPISLEEETVHHVPHQARGRPAEVLHVGLDPRGQLCVWMLLDPDAAWSSFHRFTVIGTGMPVPEAATYRGTVRDDPFMWHIFEYNQ